VAVLTLPILATRHSPLATKAKAEAERNTYGLPRGERLRRAVRDVFGRQRSAVLRYLKTGKKEHTDPLPHDWPDWNDFELGALRISERMTPLLRLTWDAAAAKFAPRVGLDPNRWDVVNPHTERMIDEAALAFCDSTNQTTSLDLDEALARTRAELRAGIVDKGESVDVLTKRINAIFDGAEKWRARRIAQTETSRAVHAAQEQAAIASGVVTGWTWLLSGDACPLCNTIARRAPAVRLGQPFAVIGDNPHYQTVKFPPAHPHCNCTVLEVLDTDVQPDFRDTLQQPQPEAEDLEQPNVKPLKPAPALVQKPPPAPPKPSADPILAAVQAAKEEQQRQNQAAAAVHPVHTLPIKETSSIRQLRADIAELKQRKIDEAEKAKRLQPEFERVKKLQQEAYNNACDWSRTARSRKIWEKKFQDLQKQFWDLDSAVTYAPCRIDSLNDQIKTLTRILNEHVAGLKPQTVHYADNLKHTPNLIAPGPIADRLAKYTLGDAKLHAIGQAAARYNKEELGLAVKRGDLNKRIAALLDEQAAEVSAAEARGQSAETVAPKVDGLQKEIDRLTDERYRVKTDQDALNKRRAADVAAVLRADQPLVFDYRDCDPGTKTDIGGDRTAELKPAKMGTAKTIKQALAWLTSVTERSEGNFGQTMELKIGTAHGARAHHSNVIKTDAEYHVLLRTGEEAGVVVHEFGHAIDARTKTGDDLVLKRALEFKAHRLKGEEPIGLREKFGGFDEYERGAKDEFDKAFSEHHAYYCGKDYGEGATEIVSMGIQKLYEDPVRFARLDPEFCKFCMGILDGSLR
jgi:hypothetical protein